MSVFSFGAIGLVCGMEGCYISSALCLAYEEHLKENQLFRITHHSFKRNYHVFPAGPRQGKEDHIRAVNPLPRARYSRTKLLSSL